MTETEIILANLFISKMTFNQPVNTYPFFSGLPKYIDSAKFDSETYSELCQMAINYGSVTAIRTYLLENDYLIVTNPLNPSDTLTLKGKAAKDKGGIKKYKIWEKEEHRSKRIEDFPKKKWFLYEPLRIITAVLLTALLTGIIAYNKGKDDAKETDQPNNHPQDQITPPKDTVQLQPKISDTSSTVQKPIYKADSIPKAKTKD